MIHLRELDEQDAESIRNWPRYGGDMAQMDYALREKGWLSEFRGRPDAFVFAVDKGTDLIGFSILAKESGNGAEFRIALRADQTGLGFGRIAAVETLKIGFEVLGLSSIHLIVRKNNFRGITLYGKIGFQVQGEVQNRIQGRRVDFYGMRLDKAAFGNGRVL